MHTLQPQVPQGLHSLQPACLKAEHLPAAYNTAYNTSRPDGVRACAGGAGEDKAASFLQTLLKIELVGTAVPPSWQEGVHYVMQGRKDSSKTVVKVVKTVDRARWLSGAPRWQEGVHYVMQGRKDSSKTVVKVVKTVDRARWLSGAPRWKEGVRVMRGKEALRPRSIGAFKAS